MDVLVADGVGPRVFLWFWRLLVARLLKTIAENRAI
jgi:hypothetical protein